MSTDLVQQYPAFAMPENELLTVLENSLYPGANPTSITLVINYCRAAGLDPMQKPVHIVPMWDSKAGRMRDAILPGIGLYRTQAARTGQYAGVGEPEFGPDVTEKIGGVEITYPAWCRVTVKRLLHNGTIAEFVAIERWKENYAVKGGKEKSIAPNAMWLKRTYAQIAKCTEAQGLRKAFPELGAAPTADEMEGRSIYQEEEIGITDVPMPQSKSKPAAIEHQEPETLPPVTIEGERVAEPVQQPAPPPAQKPAVPSNGAAVSAGQVAYIRKKADDKGIGVTELCLQHGLKSLDAMNAAQFETIKNALLAG